MMEPARYRVAALDTASPDVVSGEIVALHQRLFPDADSKFIPSLIHKVEDMFAGNYRKFQAMDTRYHDLEHTLQATLCLCRMLEGYQADPDQTPLSQRSFLIAFVAILMHDVGYLKDASDQEGTGAKFTFVHERRSCEIAHLFLQERGWEQKDIFSVQHLISCTGPRSDVTAIPFFDDTERFLGRCVATADYIGQMSDPKYPEKLDVLFEEFEESDNFRSIPKEDRLFKSREDLIRKTPGFWTFVLENKLKKECAGVFRYLERPPGSGENPYIQSVEQNLDRIRERLEGLPA
ncbi:MAG: hypothetical protein ACFE0O_13360 [Opitutales bacterium]